MGEKCENCVYYSYDEEYDAYICEMDLDEDEMVRFSLFPGGRLPLLAARRRVYHRAKAIKNGYRHLTAPIFYGEIGR